MTVTEVKQALGTWSIILDASTPRELLDAITPFGHLALVPGRAVNVAAAGDNLLSAARYVGVYRRRAAAGDITLTGAGMAFWLGDEDDKGPVSVVPIVSASATFPNAVRQFIPPALSEGTLFSIPGGGLWTNTAQYESYRTSLSYLTDSYSTSTFPVSWRVNGNGTIDAGRDVDLFVTTTPTAMLVSKNGGRDLSLVGLDGQLELDMDVEDYTTKVVLLAEGDAGSTVTASASLVTPYRDIRGNLVNLTRLVSEFETDSSNAQARAQLQLNRFTNPRTAAALSTDEYDVRGKFAVGDMILVFDPANGFIDTGREVFWRGQPINPLAMPVTELTWPVPDQWTVAFRDALGNWYDLSKYYKPEGGATTVVVGGISKSLTDASAQPIGSRPVTDNSIPATPVLGTATSSTYQTTNGNGETRGQVQLTWNLPVNSDGSTILDGDHYTIRWRPIVSAPYPATWTQANGYTWNAVAAASGTWQQPLISPILNSNWMQTVVPWGTNQILVQELTPGVTYEFQINAADGQVPANVSPFSGSTAISVAIDFFPPATPAPPAVAGANTSIQITHTLGVAAGGTYNLDADLDHLQIHVGGDPTFFPDDSNKVGKLVANIGMIRAQIPAVGTFPIQTVGPVWVKVIAVDKTGNKSGGSTAASVTALLIADAYISDLTVSKVTAGTITATWLMAGSIKTAVAGARSEMDALGIRLYDTTGSVTLNASAIDGSISMVGTLSTGKAGQRRIQINPNGGQGEIRLYSTDNSDYALISTTSLYGGTESSIQIRSSVDGNNNFFGSFYAIDQMRMGYLNNGGFSASGGLFVGATYGSFIGHYPGNSVNSGASFLQDYSDIGVNTNGAVTLGHTYRGDGAGGGLITAYGAYLNNNSFAPGTKEALVSGSSSTAGASATGLGVVYGPTMASTPWAMCVPALGTAVDPGDWWINAGPTTTGFSYHQVNNVPFRITYWCPRFTT